MFTSDRKLSHSLSNSLSFAQTPFVRIGAKKIAKIPIFQTLNPFFCYLGVFAQNVPFIKRDSFSDRFFLDQS